MGSRYFRILVFFPLLFDEENIGTPCIRVWKYFSVDLASKNWFKRRCYFFFIHFFVCFVSFLSKIFLLNLISKNFSSSYVRTYRYLLFSSHSHLFIRGFLNSVFFFFFRAIFWGMWRVFFYFILFYLGAVNCNMRGFLVLEFSFCSCVSPVLCTGV